MNILIACEYSGVVRDAFKQRGHNAVSCDLLPTEAQGKHYKGNVFDIIFQDWDMMIAFPPCTHLAVSGARWFKEKQADGRQQQGIEFFMGLVNAPIPKIAIENPIGVMSTYYKKPNQIIQPWQFGHETTKSTCLWLKRLNKLKPTNIVSKGERQTYASGRSSPIWHAKSGGGCGKERSKTYLGIAQAMAEQWG